MTKAELVESVHSSIGGFSKKESAEVVDALFELIREALVRDQEVKISGFGNFSVRRKRPRMGRNPQTGQPIPIEARSVITFKPSQILRDILNSERK